MLQLSAILLSLCVAADRAAPAASPVATPIPTETTKASATNDSKDPASSGTDAQHNDWGRTNGTVNKPILSIFELLQNPKTIRNGDNTNVTVKALSDPDFLKKYEQHITIKPIFFLTIDWTETWTYKLVKGTAEKPEVILVEYRKTEGTSHIKLLHGTIELKSTGPSTTEVSLFEEVQADRRTAEDVLKGISGTLRTLRQ